MTTIRRRLDRVEQNLVDDKLSMVMMRDQLQVPVCCVNGVPVPKEVFADFSPGHAISEQLMETLLLLLRRRDYRIVQAYADYVPRSNPEFFRTLA